MVREACADVCRKAGVLDRTIQLSFIIVTKKVNMRIFKELPNGELVNPDPGTVSVFAVIDTF